MSTAVVVVDASMSPMNEKIFTLMLTEASITEIEAAECQRQTDALAASIATYAASQETTLMIEGHHSILAIPTEIGRATKTQTLRIEHNYQLRAVPETIGLLAPRLEELSLAHNVIPSLPSSLTDLYFLKVLNLSNNRLRYLPCDIDRLKCLEDLDVQCNFITAFPAEIVYLRKIQRLQVHNNPLVDEDDKPPQPFQPPEAQANCSLCRGPFDRVTGPKVVMNFVDIAGNKSLPIAYFVCCDKCKRMVHELMDSESTNFSRLSYEMDDV